MEHVLAGASPCTVMLRSAVASVAPMFMVLELMVIYWAHESSTSITSLSSCSWVAPIISVLVKVTTTSSSTSVPDTVTEAGAMVMQSSEGTVVVVVPPAVVVVVEAVWQSVWHARHACGFPWGVAINGHASPPEWHPAQVDESTLPAAGAPEWQTTQLPTLNP